VYYIPYHGYWLSTPTRPRTRVTTHETASVEGVAILPREEAKLSPR